MKITTNQIIFILAFIWLVTYSERFLNEYQQNNINIKHKQRKDSFQHKIKQYEDEIFIDSVVITNMPLSKRDSLRSIYNPG